MIVDKFKEFDRGLDDLRNDAAIANLTMRDVVQRYVAMMDALDCAFSLYYADMTVDEKIRMKASFNKLADTVLLFSKEEPPSNIQPLHKV
jgi:hypothetical protein